MQYVYAIPNFILILCFETGIARLHQNSKYQLYNEDEYNRKYRHLPMDEMKRFRILEHQKTLEDKKFNIINPKTNLENGQIWNKLLFRKFQDPNRNILYHYMDKRNNKRDYVKNNGKNFQNFPKRFNFINYLSSKRLPHELSKNMNSMNLAKNFKVADKNQVFGSQAQLINNRDTDHKDIAKESQKSISIVEKKTNDILFLNPKSLIRNQTMNWKNQKYLSLNDDLSEWTHFFISHQFLTGITLAINLFLLIGLLILAFLGICSAKAGHEKMNKNLSENAQSSETGESSSNSLKKTFRMMTNVIKSAVGSFVLPNETEQNFIQNQTCVYLDDDSKQEYEKIYSTNKLLANMVNDNAEAEKDIVLFKQVQNLKDCVVVTGQQHVDKMLTTDKWDRSFYKKHLYDFSSTSASSQFLQESPEDSVIVDSKGQPVFKNYVSDTQ